MSIQIVVIDSCREHHLYSWLRKSAIVIGYIWFIKLLYIPEVREKRIKRYGTSNFFAIFFKEKKKEE